MAGNDNRNHALIVLLFAAISCGDGGAADLDGGGADPDAGRDALGLAECGPADASLCLPGATAEQCDACGTTPPPGCTLACPWEVLSWPWKCGYQESCAGDDRQCCQCIPEHHEWEQGGQLPCQSECEGRMRAWYALVAANDSCESGADCIMLGGRAYTCNCTPQLGGGGIGVNRALYEAAGGPAMEAEIEAAGCTPSICDSAPPENLGCVDGRCQVRQRSCLDALRPDAAP